MDTDKPINDLAQLQGIAANPAHGRETPGWAPLDGSHKPAIHSLLPAINQGFTLQACLSCRHGGPGLSGPCLLSRPLSTLPPPSAGPTFLQSANGSKIQVHCTMHRALHLAGRCFKVQILHAEVDFPLLGMNFLCHHHFLMDIAN